MRAPNPARAEQEQERREAERAPADFLKTVLFIAAERVTVIEAERYELAIMRERSAEAATRRLYDPGVIHDEPRAEVESPVMLRERK